MTVKRSWTCLDGIAYAGVPVSTGASGLRSMLRLAPLLVLGVVASMALALVGQSAGAVERDHVARVTRSATNRAHRLEADCHGTGDAADITAPADVAGEDGLVPPPHTLRSAPSSCHTGRPGVGPVAPAPPDTGIVLPLLSPDSLISRVFLMDGPGRAPPAV